jgi:PAS domain S-box-containing protein
VYDSGAISRVIGIAQDYTERKIAEQNRAFLAAIVESSDDSIIATNLEGTIVSWNAAAQSLFGYSAEEVIGQTIMLLFPQDQRGNVVPVLGRIQERGFTERTESIRVAKGERPIEVSVILSPVRDSSGTLQGISAIYRDIGERKKAERERESMEVQLRHAQKMESIGQLAAGIAHEINTPAQYIGDNTRFLKDSFGEMEEALRSQQALLALLKAGGTSPVGGEEIEAAIGRIDLEYLLTEVPKAIDQTLDGIQRITTLVGAMKEFSHPGKKEKVSTDLNSAIDNTITVARNEWKYVAEMETDYDPSLPLVPCLAGDFSQVILNLIVNAAHAIADVAKNGARGRITIRTRSRAPWAEVQVQDTGGGVPEAVRERIFEPFFTTKDVGRGTGQGLAIAHTVVVDKHGGTISYETEMGRGTTFTIRIPLQNIVQES